MPTTHPLVLAAMIGLLSGAHSAIWGMYKDSMYEGFGLVCFVRSLVVGALAAVGIQVAIHLPLPSPAAIVVLFGLAYAAERGIIEVWKTFVREEDQSKFFIPMAFSIRGVPVANRAHRMAAGAGYVAVVSLALVGIAQLDRDNAEPANLLSSALVGLIVGIIIAIGGAWKDAPKEGFQMLKFFRSPIMTLICAIALSTLTDSYLQIAVAAIGYERAAVETWKTLLTREKPPGKFLGKPELHPVMRKRRRYAVPVFLGIWAFVLAFAAAALSNASGGPTSGVAIGNARR
jgi:hypothetical protein